MIVDPANASRGALYRLLISLIVPRPIAFVSTRSAAGVTNLAPFSYFVPLSSLPPMLGIAFSDRPGDPKDTLRNIRETGEFVVNVVSEPLLERMVRTAGDWPASVSEFDVTGLTPSPSHRVAPPSVAESPVHLECRFDRELPVGNSVFVIGQVVLARVDDAVLVDGRPDPAKLAAVGRLGGESYSLMHDIVTVPRPKVSRDTGEEHA